MKSSDFTLPMEIRAQAKAIKSLTVPRGPTDTLVAGTLARIASAERTVTHVRSRRRFYTAGMASLAAAALFLFLGIPYSSGLTSAAAFSMVQEKVEKAESVSCLAKFSALGWRVEMKVILQGDHIRMEDQVRAYEGSLMNVSTQDQEKRNCIIDLRQRRMLVLYPARKVASENSFDEAIANIWANPVAQLRRLPPANAQRLGKSMVGNKTMEEYVVSASQFLGLVSIPNCRLHVWVDVANRLPTKIEIRETNSSEPLIAFTDITWNQPQDPRLFQLTVPSEYQLNQKKE